MVIKRNVIAFINNSTEYCCAHCAYSVISGILELFNCCTKWHSLCQDMLYSLLVCVYGFVCVLIMCVRVCSTSYFFPYFFMGSLSIDCAVLQKREMGPHSWWVTRSLPYSLSAWPLSFFFFSPPPSSSSLFLFCLGRRPQLARYPHRAMPEGAPRSWRIVRCSNGSVGVT